MNYYRCLIMVLLFISSVVKGASVEPQSVDLGLLSGTRWANMNIGAENPYDYGDYYAWGETDVKPNLFFSIENYKFYVSEENILEEGGYDFVIEDKGYTKYVQQDEAGDYGFKGYYDNLTELEPVDDIAQKEWGKGWRIPNSEQSEELLQQCTWTKVSLNGIKGYKVTGPNGNFIFLPAGGYCYENWISNKIEEYACYWTSSVKTWDPMMVYTLDYTGSSNNGVVGNRYSGRLVRPVYTTDNDIETKKAEIYIGEDKSSIEVYTLSGVCISNDPDNYTLSSGVYIIKQSGKSKKLIVR